MDESELTALAQRAWPRYRDVRVDIGNLYHAVFGDDGATLLYYIGPRADFESAIAVLAISQTELPR